jgi:hypothetical protein
VLLHRVIGIQQSWRLALDFLSFAATADQLIDRGHSLASRTKPFRFYPLREAITLLDGLASYAVSDAQATIVAD